MGSNIETDNASQTDQRRRLTPEEEREIQEEAKTKTHAEYVNLTAFLAAVHGVGINLDR